MKLIAVERLSGIYLVPRYGWLHPINNAGETVHESDFPKVINITIVNQCCSATLVLEHVATGV
jgi:hypothetical protein